VTHIFAGEYRDAQDHLERAHALFQPGRDDDLTFRFGHDAGVAVMLYLAIALWPLGDVARSIALVERAERRIEGISHIGTLAFGKMHAAMFEMMRGDYARALSNVPELVRVADEYNLKLWSAFGAFLRGWAASQGSAPVNGLEDMRRGAESLRKLNVVFFDGLLKIALAKSEARAGDYNRALIVLDEALATSDNTGHRAFDADLHRVRGELVLARDPGDRTIAEEAFNTALTTAKEQDARSYELFASLALATLYQSTARRADAHAVLAPALEGFSPTPEMPEIAQAHALLESLARGG
jgi:predicted ATPase